MLPQFIKKIDQKILKSNFTLWSTRLVPTLFWFSLVYLIVFLLSYLFMDNAKDYEVSGIFVGFLVIASILLLIGWLRYLVQFNPFKQYAKLPTFYPTATLLQYWLICTLIITLPFLPRFAASFKTKQQYDLKKVNADIRELNLAHISLLDIEADTQSKENKTILYKGAVLELDSTRKWYLNNTTKGLDSSYYYRFYLNTEFFNGDTINDVRVIPSQKKYRRMNDYYYSSNVELPHYKFYTEIGFRNTLKRLQTKQLSGINRYYVEIAKNENLFVTPASSYGDWGDNCKFTDFIISEEDINTYKNGKTVEGLETKKKAIIEKYANTKDLLDEKKESSFVVSTTAYPDKGSFGSNAVVNGIENIFKNRFYAANFITNKIYLGVLYGAFFLSLLIFLYRHSTIKAFFISVVSAIILLALIGLTMAATMMNGDSIHSIFIFAYIVVLLVAFIGATDKVRSYVNSTALHITTFFAATIAPLFYTASNFGSDNSFDEETMFNVMKIGVVVAILFLQFALFPLYKKWWSSPEE